MSVSQHDWSLHRKGQVDQERHKEKIREAIKKNLGDIVNSGNPQPAQVNRFRAKALRPLRSRIHVPQSAPAVLLPAKPGAA